MTRRAALTGLVPQLCLSLACALVRAAPPTPMPVWVRSLNASEVDVYLACGSHDALQLGTIEEEGSDAFQVPEKRLLCGEGLNFFLLVREGRRGYWVGPFWPRATEGVRLLIEEYAGLSSAELIAGMR